MVLVVPVEAAGCGGVTPLKTVRRRRQAGKDIACHIAAVNFELKVMFQLVSVRSLLAVGA